MFNISTETKVVTFVITVLGFINLIKTENFSSLIMIGVTLMLLFMYEVLK